MRALQITSWRTSDPTQVLQQVQLYIVDGVTWLSILVVLVLASGKETFASILHCW